MTRLSSFLRGAPGRRWLALLAIGLALAGESLVAGARAQQQGPAPPPALAWGLFAIAGFLFAAAVWAPPALPRGEPAGMIVAARAHPRRRVFGVLLGLSLLCGAGSAPLFATLNAGTFSEPANTGGWLLWIAALLLFGGAWGVWERGAPGPAEGETADAADDRLPPRLEWAATAGLFLVGLACRVPDLQNVPPGLWFDEAQNGITGLGLLHPGAAHPTFIGALTQMGALPFYFLGGLLKVVGPEIWPLRILPAVSGAVLVPLLYILAARLYGWRAGLAAAGLLAVSAWNITFSRFGIVSLATVALDVAVYLCIAQALRTARLGFYAGAGVLLGLALQTYYVARLVPLVLLAVLAHQLIATRLRIVRQVRMGLLVFAVGGVLAFLPVGLFALQQPATFTGRVNQVSVFNPEVNGGDRDAFATSLRQHLLMFNYQGDRNGRHNLPGAPMLDDLTAALFFLGLGAFVARAWRWQYAFPLVWFLAALSGGVLSLPFEAPQSHRTLENSVVTALIAGVVVGEAATLLAGKRRAARAEPKKPRAARVPGPRFGRRAPTPVATSLPTRRVPHSVTARFSTSTATAEDVSTLPAEPAPNSPGGEPLPAGPRAHGRSRLLGQALGLILVVGTVALAGAANLPRYFAVQARDRSVWEEMTSAETLAGRTLRQDAATSVVYVSPQLNDKPSMQYLAPDIPSVEWPGMNALPLRPTGGRNVSIVLDYAAAADMAAIPRIYPHATMAPFGAPASSPLAYTIHIPAADIEAARGVRATIRAAANALPQERTLSDFAVSGTTGPPGSTVRLSSTVRVERYGNYRFAWVPASPAAPTLRVDGAVIPAGGSLNLPIGLHSIVATATVQAGTVPMSLGWAVGSDVFEAIPATNLFDPRRVEPHGLTGQYAPGAEGTASPQTARVDPVISFYVHNLLVGRPYHVDWSGRLYVPVAGEYALGTEQISASTLTLDGRQLLRNEAPNQMQESRQQLTAGWHTLHLHFVDREEYSHIYLYWTPPGRPHSIIPSAFLWPELAEYPVVPESGAWPTLSDSDSLAWLPRNTGGAAAGPAAPPVTLPAASPVATPPAAAVTPAAGPPNEVTTIAPPAGQPWQPSLVLGGPESPLPHPRGVGADASGNLYIYTEGDSTVHKFDPTGHPVATWPVVDAAGKPLTEGAALLVHNGKILVLDGASAGLLTFDPVGKLEARVHLCECYYPRGLAAAAGGDLWVADTGNGRLVQVSTNGVGRREVGSRGTGPAQFIEPAGVWESPTGDLYVADIGNGRIQRLKTDGTPLGAWPAGASVARDGNRVTGTAGGEVFVTETATRSVVRFSADGRETGRWVYSPAGSPLLASAITSLSNGRLGVVFLFDDRVGLFAPGK